MTEELRTFPPFRLDTKNQRLWRENQEVRLRRKTFAVLRHLVERPGELVTKATLLDAVWPNVSVSDSMPAISVRELRTALGDDAQTPRFIETVQGRGYRFIAKVESQRARTRVLPSSQDLSSRPSRSAYVGRDREISTLRAALANTSSGHGQLVLVFGEPGIGKSRLCEELSTEAEAKGVSVLAGHCSEMEAVAYLPFVEILEGGISRAEGPKQLLRTLGDEGPELGRLLPKLRRRVPELPPPPELPPEEARRSLFDSVCNFLTRQSLERTVLLILEDLHWADDSTLALLSDLSRRITQIPLMVIGTYRSNKSDVGPGLTKTLEDLVRGRLATQIELVGLAVTEVALMLQGLGDQVPPVTVASEFFAETDGNPFFVEELFQFLAEEKRLYDSTGRYRSELKIRELDVPRSVQLVVGRRLARLDEATGKLLATAAVIGRSFSFDLLERSRGVDAEFALDCLDESEKVGLIRSCATDTEARFEFCHELVRQAVLNQLSAARRQRLHRQVAEAIERIHPEALEDHYVELAHHYSHTDNIWKAAEYLLLSGKQAVRRSAYGSAENYLNSGLRLLSKLPEATERDAIEVKLQLTLGTLQLDSKGYGAEAPETALLRAEELCDRLGDRAALFDAEIGLITIHQIRGEIRDTLIRTERLFDLAEGESRKIVSAHFLVGRGLFWMGELVPSREHMESAISLSEVSAKAAPRSEQSSADQLILSQCWTYCAWTLWYLGYPDQALEKIQQTLRIARQHPQSELLAGALCHAARVRLMRREVQLVMELAEEASELATALGMPSWIAESAMLRGWALVFGGREADGVQLVLNGLAEENKIRDPGWYFGGWPAEACGKAGRISEAVELVANLLKPGHEVYVFEADLHRVKGELLLMNDPSNVKDAENSFRIAVDLARRGNFKSLSLSATTSLARLLAAQGRREEARAMLDEIYGWFTEGFDTADLKDAKALLNDLKS